MQDYYRYCTAHTQQAQYSPTLSTKVPLLMFRVLVVLIKETIAKMINSLTLSSTRTAVRLLQHVYTQAICHHSRSLPKCQLTFHF